MERQFLPPALCILMAYEKEFSYCCFTFCPASHSDCKTSAKVPPYHYTLRLVSCLVTMTGWSLRHVPRSTWTPELFCLDVPQMSTLQSSIIVQLCHRSKLSGPRWCIPGHKALHRDLGIVEELSLKVTSQCKGVIRINISTLRNIYFPVTWKSTGNSWQLWPQKLLLYDLSNSQWELKLVLTCQFI